MSNLPDEKFNFDEFLNLAEWLASRGDAASKRSAISRAYYAIFHRAENRLGERPVPPPQTTSDTTEDNQTSSHVACWNRYEASVNELSREIGGLGKRIKISRQRADYRDTFGKLDEHTKLSIQLAKKVLTKLDDLDPNFPE
jgi:uncharacterized protein (UPF0332 family)